MNKLLKITTSILIFLLLLMTGLYFLLFFTPLGSTLAEPYIKKELEEKIGMPVDIKALDLGYETANLTFSISEQAQVNVALSHFDLSSEKYEGSYQIKTDTFAYGKKRLNNADINGNFKYMPEEIYLQGEGTALDAKVDYRLNIIDDLPQQVLLNIKDAQLSEVLQLAGQPEIAEGKIDVKVNIPDMAGDRENIYGYIDLKKSYFKPEKVKELYDFTIPEKSYLHGRVDGNLEGENVKLVGALQSNLFVLQIKEALVSMFTEDWSAKYDLDVQDMRILTKNKLAGALDLRGDLKGVGKRVEGKANSTSLDGNLHFSVYQIANVTFDHIALEKMLVLLKQPVYAKGRVNGTASLKWYPSDSGKVGKVLSWHEWSYAAYDLRIDKGVLTAKAREALDKYDIPAKNRFSLHTKGKIAHKKLTSNAAITSTLADVKFSSLNYDFKKKTLTSNYNLQVHDVNSLIQKAKVAKGTAVKADGKLTFKEKLNISGVLKGMGKKVAFSHDSKTLKFDALELLVEKLLPLLGEPAYVKGTMDSQIVLTNLKPHEGKFTIKNANFKTQPREMKKLIGEGLKADIVLNASGTFKEGIGYGQSSMNTSIGDIFLEKIVYDSKTKAFKTNYTLDIPNLKEWHKVIDRKLYGPLKLNGTWSQEKVRRVNGETNTLGGKISYQVVGDALNSSIDNVPLDNILGLLGHKKNFLGKAFGKGKYDLKRKTGVVDIDIKDFQIKPSPATNTIKMLTGKDPGRVIFDSTTFHADIKGKVTTYNLHAKGTRSSVDITEGRIDKINDTNTAKFTFVYEKYTVHGKIKGSIKDPKVTVDTSAILKDKIDEELQNKIEDALGGKAGEFLKNLKF